MKQVKLKHKYKIACEHKNNIVIAKKKKKEIFLSIARHRLRRLEKDRGFMPPLK